MSLPDPDDFDATPYDIEAETVEPEHDEAPSDDDEDAPGAA